MKTTVRYRGSSLPAVLPPDTAPDDIIAIHMEAMFLDGWMAYTVRSTHSKRFRKDETVLVKFSKGVARRLLVTVKYTRKRWKNGELVDFNELTYPKANYWFWPGLEDEVHARTTRELRKRGTTEKRRLKPY